MYNTLLIRYGEISLKGRNRAFFEDKLVANIRASLAGLASLSIKKTFGRIYLELPPEDGAIIETLVGGLKKVFGVVSLSPAVVTPLDLEAMKNAALQILLASPGKSFKIETTRAFKDFPYTSPEINRLVGAYLQEQATGRHVDVHQPDQTIHLEIRQEGAYIYNQVIPGPGGLPVGMSGRGLLLLSGGIDSPVAGWLGLKRGLDLTCLHFYSFPFTSERSKEKVIDLSRLLADWAGYLRLLIAPFTEIQKAIRQNCPEEFYVTIIRRFMFRVAREAAVKEGALALLTGESLGQVASQTLESINVINKVVDLPVFRPLISLDKAEIVRYAREIGSYDISIRPYEDCCTLFVPKHPATKPELSRVERAETKLEIEKLVARCVENLELIELPCASF